MTMISVVLAILVGTSGGMPEGERQEQQELFLAWEATGEVEDIQLDLSGWVSLALSESPELMTAEADLTLATEGRRSARSLLLPTLSLSANGGRTWSTLTVPGSDPEDITTDSYSASLTLSQDILASGGSNWLELRAQGHAVAAAEEDYRAAVLDLELSVLESFYGVVEALELVRSAERALERSVRQLERVEALYDMGGATTLEYLQASVQESRDRLTTSQRRQLLRTAYYDLYDAAGISPSGEVRYLVDIDAVLTPISMRTAGELDLDLSRSASLVSARERLEQSELSWSADRRSYWPSLSVSGSYSWSDDELEFADWQDEDSWNVMVSLRWTIFDGWLRESRIGSSRASYLRSRAGVESLESSLEASAVSLRESLMGSIESYELAQLSLELAGETYELSARSYELGATSLLDLLDSQASLADAEAAEISALTDCLIAEARLLTLLGRHARLGE
jgi:outer membrane protein TolC